MAQQYLAQIQSQKQMQILAPQLRQSLELLQVPILELRALIEQELQQNPTLDEQPNENEQVEIEPGSGDGNQTEDKEEELNFDKEFDALTKLDDEWRDYFRQTNASVSNTRDDESRRQHFMDSLTVNESLQEHLLDQLAFAELGPQERQIGEMIIGSINDDGFLTNPLEELAQSTGYDLKNLERILVAIQTFDPIGVGARSISECLLLQLVRLGKEESLEAEVVRNHLQELGTKKFPAIAKALKISVNEVQQISRFISTLDPKPGRMFTSESTSYVLPEIMIQKVNGNYIVIMNDDQIPHLRISRHYRNLMEDKSTTSEVKGYIRDKVRAGTFLIKSISQRQTTIKNIATEIVKVQQEFFDHGVSLLRPLTMNEVASVLGIHETTVSRAIANKYMQTPQGVFEMKYFFTPGFKTRDGKDVSNKSIKDAISTLVSGEDDSKPLSDQAIVELLKQQGLKVARRTVAKYRDELNILPSHLRKSF